jgi:hypothetical protein
VPTDRLLTALAAFAMALAGCGPEAGRAPQVSLEPRAPAVHLGATAGYAKIGLISKTVLATANDSTLQLAELPAGSLHFAAAHHTSDPDDERSAASCSIELRRGSSPHAPIARIELPAGSARWVEAIAEVPAVAKGQLRFACARADGTPAEAVWARPIAVPQRSEAAAPLIVLISLDTLRADYVDGFGGKLGLTPHLGALANEGLRLQNATSEGAWTLASHFALLFSRLYGFPVDRKPLTSLAQTLADEGFVTAGLTGGGFMGAAFNYHLGFDHYAEYNTAADDLPLVLADALPTIERFTNAPTFLFLHTFSVHEMPPNEIEWHEKSGIFSVFRPNAEQIASARDFYTKVVHRSDAELASFFDELRTIAAIRPVLVVIISDHGEAFGEHRNFRHGFGDRHVTLHDEVIRVPIIVWGPGLVAPGRSSDVPTMLADVAPSILAAVGAAAPASMVGSDYWPLWSRDEAPAPDPDRGGVSHTDGVWSFRNDRAKLIVEMTQRGGRRKGFELYDLANDPGEQRNLVRERPQQVTKMRASLRRRLDALGVPVPANASGLPRCGHCSWQDRDSFWQVALEDSAVDGATTPGEVDEDTLQRLRDLGYTD